MGYRLVGMERETFNNFLEQHHSVAGSSTLCVFFNYCFAFLCANLTWQNFVGGTKLNGKSFDLVIHFIIITLSSFYFGKLEITWYKEAHHPRGVSPCRTFRGNYHSFICLDDFARVKHGSRQRCVFLNIYIFMQIHFLYQPI